MWAVDRECKVQSDEEMVSDGDGKRKEEQKKKVVGVEKGMHLNEWTRTTA